MKFKTTQKAIKNGYRDIVCVGYCNLQHLLNCESAIAYTTRAEGWGADIYSFGSVAIVTGYAPFGTIRPAYDIQRKYDEYAREIVGNYSIKYEERKTMLASLLEQFFIECGIPV